jgi:acetyl esterase/lipase
MRSLVIILTFLSTIACSQDKTYLYPSSQKVTIDGFDKEPPFIEFFKAKGTPNGSTILVVPGGGYTVVTYTYEGNDVATFYNEHGFDAYVLHYRINDGEHKGHHHPAQYNDVTRAIRIVKSKAKNPERVGILGFSAGGHLSSMAATMHLPANKNSKDPLEHFSSRPAFAILLYPVITFGEKAHTGSREMLIGKNPDVKMIDSLSTEKQVDKYTSPTFIIYSTDDDVVPVENGIMFYEALRKHNVPATIHIYDHGGHGYGLGGNDPVLSSWGKLSIDWIKSLRY